MPGLREMRKDLYKELYEVENQHWWHHHKRAIVHQLIERFASKGMVLDVGAGTGKTLAELKTKGWLAVGLDSEQEAVEWSKKRGIKVRRCDLETEKFPFRSNQFELVLALDVLEHIGDEKEVLSEIRRVLKPKGIVIITVPAYQRLFNYWDKMLGHQRRYTVKLLKKRLQKAGFKISYLSYFCLLFLPLAILVRFIKRLSGKKTQTISDFQTTPLAPISIPLLKLYAKIELLLLQYLSLPFGLSIVGVFER